MIRYALITGGSRGIGYELAKQFAANGFSLVMTARGAGALARAAATIVRRYGVEVKTFPCDLSQDSGPEQLFQKIRNQGIGIHTLVNNAGIGLCGPFLDTDGLKEMRLMHLNMVSPVRLSRLLLPEISAARGGILNVASTAAFQPGPLMSVYYASKAFVLSFSESLAEEYAGTGTTITALCPGPTRSDFTRDSGIDNSRLIRSGILKTMSAREVAAFGFSSYINGKRIAIPGLRNRLGVVLMRNIPRHLSLKIIKKLNELRQ